MNRISKLVVLPISLVLLGASALAEEGKMGPPTKEQRAERAAHHEKMAETHKKMAECLRSSKPLADCRQLMAGAMGGAPGQGGPGGDGGTGSWGPSKGEGSSKGGGPSKGDGPSKGGGGW